MASVTLLVAVQIGISTWDFRAHSRTIWAWLLIGLVAGWLSGFAFRGRGFGCIANIVLGLIGSVIGGWLFTYFKIMGGDFYYSLAAATVGALILVAIARLFAGEPRK